MGTHRDPYPQAARWRIVAVGVLLLLLTGAPRVAIAAAAPADPCAAAALLASQGQLVKAEEELTHLPQGTTCPTVTSAVADRREQAAQYVARAKTALQASDFASAAALAAQALALDDGSAEAKAAKAAATAGTANEIALKQAVADRDKSELQRLGDEWTRFYDTQIAPVGSLLLPFAAVLVVLLLLTRLLVLWVPRWGEINAGQGHGEATSARAPVATLGILSLVGGAFVLTVAAAHTQQGQISAPGRPALITAWVIGMILFVGSIIWAHQQSDLNKPSFPLWLAVVGAALGIVALAPMLLRTTAGDEDSMGWVDVWAVLLLGALLSALGVWLTAWWLATRLRLGITYTDAEGKDQKTMAALVAAYLNELGAEPPRGLEVPRGTDVTALDGALATLPDNAVLRALKSFLTGLTGVTPWTASIDAGERTLAVSVRRNARSVGSAVLDADALGLVENLSGATASTSSSGSSSGSSSASANGSTPAGDNADDGGAARGDLLRMAAAFVLASMAPKHHPIRRGLAGATDWKSLGYHYVATAGGPAGSGERGQTLLARALNEDPENRLARLAFHWAVDRNATDSTTLVRYATFLEGAYADLDANKHRFEVGSLVLRVRYVRALVLINAAYAYDSETRALPEDTSHEELSSRQATLGGLQEQAKQALGALITLLRDGNEPDGDHLSHFKAQFRDDIQGTQFLIGISQTEGTVNTPIGMYNLGATYASRNDLPWPGAARLPVPVDAATATDDRTAMELLRRACTIPRNKEWVASDPQLDRFRERTAYRNAFLAEPRTDLFDLDPVKPIAERLRAAGYGTVSLLAAESPAQLETRTYVSAATCLQVIELARLRSSLGAFAGSPGGTGGTVGTGAKPLDEWAVEVLDQLLARGLASHEALARLGDAERVTTMEAVVKAVLKKCRLGDKRDADSYAASLQEWLVAWAPRPAPMVD